MTARGGTIQSLGRRKPRHLRCPAPRQRRVWSFDAKNHTTRTCRNCSETKSADEFVRYVSRGVAGHRSLCKRCYGLTRAPATRWDLKIYDLRRRGGKVPRSRELRDALGEPTTCYLCGDGVDWSTVALDHKVPMCQGGTHDVANLGWAHRQCNLLKSWRSVSQFRELVGKFHHQLGCGDCRKEHGQ